MTVLDPGAGTSTWPFALLVQCPDRRGVVAAVSACLADTACSITQSHQFSDPGTGRFFMRMVFVPEAPGADRTAERLDPIARRFEMQWSLHDLCVRPRVLVAVSRFGHCLYDLLHRWRSGLLPVEIVGVASNHDDMRSFSEWSGVPYHHLPVDPHDRPAQEGRLLDLVARERVELVVLARYMQILSPAMCQALAGRCINIHHSFLPSFKGARPYHQAYARGVKIIGATAHYVTTELDEGPIIEQAVERVSHAHAPQDLVMIGRDMECAVLARAILWHAERRLMTNGQRTVVFA